MRYEYILNYNYYKNKIIIVIDNNKPIIIMGIFIIKLKGRVIKQLKTWLISSSINSNVFA